MYLTNTTVYMVYHLIPIPKWYYFQLGICCSGIIESTSDPSDSCMFYDCFTKSWIPLPDMPRRLIGHRSNVIRQKGRDWRWLIAGGIGK